MLLLVLGLELNVLTSRTRATTATTARALDRRVLLAWSLPGALAGVAVLRALPAEALQVAVTLGVFATLAARRVRAAHVRAAPRASRRRRA